MYSISGSRITCDEENRQVKGYEITMNYKHNISELQRFDINSDDNVIGSITYEHNGKIFMVNKGVRVKSKSSNEISLQTFNFCSACGQWLARIFIIFLITIVFGLKDQNLFSETSEPELVIHHLMQDL